MSLVQSLEPPFSQMSSMENLNQLLSVLFLYKKIFFKVTVIGIFCGLFFLSPCIANLVVCSFKETAGDVTLVFPVFAQSGSSVGYFRHSFREDVKNVQINIRKINQKYSDKTSVIFSRLIQSQVRKYVYERTCPPRSPGYDLRG